MKRRYYGMVTHIDDHVGRLLQSLRDRGLEENTLVLFTSEHGAGGRAVRPEEVSAERKRELLAGETFHFCNEARMGQTKSVCTRTCKYNVTAGDVDELYDLVADPNELVNILSDAAYDDVVRELRDVLMRWMVDTELDRRRHEDLMSQTAW